MKGINLEKKNLQNLPDLLTNQIFYSKFYNQKQFKKFFVEFYRREKQIYFTIVFEFFLFFYF